jgi:hypothetical protein
MRQASCGLVIAMPRVPGTGPSVGDVKVADRESIPVVPWSIRKACDYHRGEPCAVRPEADLEIAPRLARGMNELCVWSKERKIDG